MSDSSYSASAAIHRLRSGEVRAFETLVRAHGSMLLALARRHLGNEADAWDALQDGLRCAFRGIHSFRRQAMPSTWLYRVVVNACLMHLRARRRRGEVSLGVLETPRRRVADVASRGEVCASERSIQRHETRRLVRGAIDRLAPAFREIITLRDLQERDTAEAARILGISRNAARIRLHRARRALREVLQARAACADRPSPTCVRVEAPRHSPTIHDRQPNSEVRSMTARDKRRAARESKPRAARRKGLTREERHRRIAEAAYYLAQRRGFVGGDAQADWYAAAAAVDAEVSKRPPETITEE